ncbi:Hypothetical predicted protein [Olea europaea subsp. europaea]|uniref:Uncharacterized protein n=1 Tax=Olea europaea subsp. europaea TaxID=158383 RepID=A0A8S0S8H1_OLEEU|nr:Hypothetical predicted protein [Olea europaea subsp. europaea]
MYELISTREAIVKANNSLANSKALFEEVLNKPDPRDDLSNSLTFYPQLRPSMRSIAVALMTLSSTIEDWDVTFFFDEVPLEKT